MTAPAGQSGDLELRLQELRHRMKNMLAVVQSVANQTLRSGRSIEEARTVLEGRLVAMGHAADMLLRTAWSSAELEALIAGALVHGRERVAMRGPAVALGPEAAMALSLVFHELEANAVKYGALSAPEGSVRVDWTVTEGEQPRLALEWREHGGPPCRPPLRRGFGSRLISKVVGARFSGSSVADYAADGFRWRLEAPLAALGA